MPTLKKELTPELIPNEYKNAWYKTVNYLVLWEISLSTGSINYSFTYRREYIESLEIFKAGIKIYITHIHAYTSQFYLYLYPQKCWPELAWTDSVQINLLFSLLHKFENLKWTMRFFISFFSWLGHKNSSDVWVFIFPSIKISLRSLLRQVVVKLMRSKNMIYNL